MTDRIFNSNNSANSGKLILAKSLVRFVTGSAWYLAPRFITGMMMNHFFAPGIYRLSSRQREIAKKGDRFELDVNGKTVRGWRWGEGPMVYLLHGWGGSGLQLSEFVEPLTSSGYSVIAWDQPAHGDSDGKTTNLIELVMTFKAVIEKQGKPSSVIGHSMGAVVALNMQRAVEDSFRFVLLAPPYDMEEELRRFAVVNIGVHEKLFETTMRRLEEEFKIRVKDLSPVSTASIHDSETLILHDVNDRVTPFKQAEMLREKMKNVTLVKTTGLGHNRILFDRPTIESAVKFIRGDLQATL
jgi:pimeloyl-ACP methyl ester carboxylesterase